MSVHEVRCARCGMRISAHEVATGAAVARNGFFFCRPHAPALPGLDQPTQDLRAPGAIPSESPTQESARFGDDSKRLLDEGRRKRAERRIKGDADENEEELEHEPFPWLLVVAGASAALLIVLALSIAFRASDAPADDAASADSKKAAEGTPPPAAPDARKLADAVLAKARGFEARDDFEAAYLSLELPASSPIRDDDGLVKEIARERDRLGRKRQLARARAALRQGDGMVALDALKGIADGPDADAAALLRAEAERLLKRGSSSSDEAPQASHRARWLEQAGKALGTVTEAQTLERRRTLLAANETLRSEFKEARVAHACYEDQEQKFRGDDMLEGMLNKAELMKRPTARGHLPILLRNPGLSRFTFAAAPEPKPFRRVAIAIYASALAPDELRDLDTGILTVTVNDLAAGELVFVDADTEVPRVLEVTARWRADGPNRVVVTLGDGPSSVAVDLVEVLTLD